jgi:predicted nucleotidyltransferase
MIKKPNMGNITQKWVDILITYSNDYSIKLSTSELSRRSGIPQQTVSRYLNRLAKLTLIDYVREGKSKLFYFDLEKQTSRIIINLIENQKSLKFHLKTKRIAVIISEILKNCESLIVFGSYASGDFSKDSDLDLLILGKYNKAQIKKIKTRQIMEINEHYASYDEFSKILNSRNPLSIEIMKNHVLFGDNSKIIDIFLRGGYGQR